MPVPTPSSFIGVAKEVTRGTALAATDYIPVTTLNSPNDMYHTVSDTGFRGAPVVSFDELPTQAWAEPSYGGNVYVDSIGFWLNCLFGVDTVGAAVSGVYPHTFTALTTGDFQPPSYCISDYNGVDTRQIPGFLVSELAFQFTATGLLTYTVKGLGFKSAETSNPTPGYTAERAIQGWSGVTTLGGGATSIMQDGSIAITRVVETIPTIGQQDPYRIWGGAVGITGQMNLVFENTTEFARYTGGTSTTLDINFFRGAAATLRGIRFIMSKVLYTAATPTRSKSYVELPITFSAVANTTDALSRYGPGQVQLQNTRSAAY